MLQKLLKAMKFEETCAISNDANDDEKTCAFNCPIGRGNCGTLSQCNLPFEHQMA